MANNHEYNIPLSSQLATCIDNYEASRDAYWQDRLTAAEWSPINQLRKDASTLADLIRRRALALHNEGTISELNDIYTMYQFEREKLEQEYYDDVVDALKELWKDKGKPDDEIHNLIEANKSEFLRAFGTHEFDPYNNYVEYMRDAENYAPGPLHLVGEQLAVDEARGEIDSLIDRVNRILELDRMINDVLDRESAEACVEFLALVSRCYVHGLIPECAVMCRSAMEQAFRAQVSDQHCEQANRRRKKHGFGLEDRIEAAFFPDNSLLDLPPFYVPAVMRVGWGFMVC